VTLHYAFSFDPPAVSVQPYYFSCTIQGIELATERQVRRFPTTTQELLALAEWLESLRFRPLNFLESDQGGLEFS